MDISLFDFDGGDFERKCKYILDQLATIATAQSTCLPVINSVAFLNLCVCLFVATTILIKCNFARSQAVVRGVEVGRQEVESRYGILQEAPGWSRGWVEKRQVVDCHVRRGLQGHHHTGIEPPRRDDVRASLLGLGSGQCYHRAFVCLLYLICVLILAKLFQYAKDPAQCTWQKVLGYPEAKAMWQGWVADPKGSGWPRH